METHISSQCGYPARNGDINSLVPNEFELQFNMLQNTIIDRLNEKIKEAQAEDELQNGKIDFFLLQSAKKLQRVDEGIKRFLYENAHNTRAMGPILKHLDKLDDALDANDTNAFNKELKIFPLSRKQRLGTFSITKYFGLIALTILT